MEGRPPESSEEFLNLIQHWQKLEDKAIGSADSMLKTSNPFFRVIMESLKHDSEKCKLIQQMIIDSIAKGAIKINPDELKEISDMLNNHMEVEAESLRLAHTALAKSELVFTRFLLSYLIADKDKHHDLIERLNDLKGATILA
jgi:hypothetical protein